MAYRKTAHLDLSELARLYEEGLSVRELAERFGVSSVTIRDRLEEYGYAGRLKRGSKVVRRRVLDLGLGSKEEAEDLLRSSGGLTGLLIRLRSEGKSIRYGTLRLCLLDLGIVPGDFRSYRFNKERRVKTGDLVIRYKDGLSARAIAKEFGVSHQTVLNR